MRQAWWNTEIDLRGFSRIEQVNNVQIGKLNSWILERSQFPLSIIIFYRPLDILLDILSPPRKTKISFPVLLLSVSRETLRRDRARCNYPPSPASCSPSSSLFLSFPAAIEVSCRSGHVARPDSNSLFRAQPIVDKEKRLMKYYATRKYMPAHAALPLIRTRENRPFESQGARWTANSARDATLYRFNILFPPTGPPLGSSHLPSLRRAISIPYLVPLSFLHGPVIPYVWHTASSSSERDEHSFGIRHWPLATFVADLTLSWDLA